MSTLMADPILTGSVVFCTCPDCKAEFPGDTGASDYVRHVCQPIDPARERATARRNRCEAALRAAFQAALAELGWQPTLEALGLELNAHRDEAKRWDTEVWAQRSKAVYELAEDADLR